MNASPALRVCVFCGSHVGNDPRYVETARSLGAEIARRGWGLVFGGGKTGLMGEVSRSVLAAGGEVIGVIPKILQDLEPPQAGLKELHVVDTMRERKALMSELSDVFVVLPGGIGTLEEAFEALTNNWIGAFHKPLGFLDATGYYDELFSFLEHAVDAGFLPCASFALSHRAAQPEVLLDELSRALSSAPSIQQAREKDAKDRLRP